jgi:hypothetical protein
MASPECGSLSKNAHRTTAVSASTGVSREPEEGSYFEKTEASDFSVETPHNEQLVNAPLNGLKGEGAWGETMDSTDC